MGHRIQIQPAAFLLAAAVILILPLRWWTGALLAGLLHECAHLLAVHLLGEKILDITITPFGTEIRTLPMGRFKGAAASAAGPLGSLITLFFARFFPEMAVCGFVQGVYNLLPVFPLDGGRIVQSMFSEKMCDILEVVTVVLISLLGFWLWENSSLGMASFLPATAVLILCLPRKLSCKDSIMAVQ